MAGRAASPGKASGVQARGELTMRRQGAMLALDCVFQEPPLAVDALALWSASRLSCAS